MTRAAQILCFLFCFSVGQTSFAQTTSSDLSFSVALRAYANRIDGTGYGSTGIPGLNPSYVNVSTSTRVSFLPSASLRYGRIVVAGSLQPTTRYESSVVESPGITALPERKEWDISVGYAVLPSVVLSLGWKEIDIATSTRGRAVSVATPLPQSYSGPFVGAAASAPLSADLSLYGTVAYGRPDNKVDGIKIGTSTDYISSEFGLQYSLRGLGQSFERATLLLGYRSQTSRTKNAAVSIVNVNPQTGAVAFQNTTLSSRSSINGVTLGIAFAF